MKLPKRQKTSDYKAANYPFKMIPEVLSAMIRSSRRSAGARRAPWPGAPTLAVLLITALQGLGMTGHAVAEDLQKSGTVQIEQVQIAFIGSGNLGGGTLSYGGKSYRFKIGGLGIGGIGLSKMTATGNVYNLHDLAYFPGAYAQARYGAVVGDASAGKLWLRNANGVVLELTAERKGLALSLGGDAVYINLN